MSEVVVTEGSKVVSGWSKRVESLVCICSFVGPPISRFLGAGRRSRHGALDDKIHYEASISRQVVSCKLTS